MIILAQSIVSISDTWINTIDIKESAKNPNEGLSGGFSIATWYTDPDTWDNESGATSETLILLENSLGEIIYISKQGNWQTQEGVVSSKLFEDFGFKKGELSMMSTENYLVLYSDFNPPFKVHIFKEEDSIKGVKAKVDYSENEYTMARSYEVEISESDLQKIKTLSVI